MTARASEKGKEEVKADVPVPFELPFEVPVVVGRDGVLPARAHDVDAGYDLTAAIDDPRGLIIRPGSSEIVSTEVRVAVPEGMVGLVCPRSGLAFNHGVTLLNSPGVIDPGYTGPVKAVLMNLGRQAFHLRPGDRIAQLVFLRLAPVELVQVDGLTESGRGDNGFGSTGR